MYRRGEVTWVNKEKPLWRGWGSAAGLLPLFEEYVLYPDRLMVRRGFLGSTEEELLLYRVVDITLQRSLLEHLTGSGTVVLHALDASDPVLRLRSISRPKAVRDLLDEAVMAARDAAGVTGREMWGGAWRVHEHA